MPGFASHRRHNLAVRDDWGRGVATAPGLLSFLLQGAQEPDHRSRDPLCRKGLWQRNRQHWLIRRRVPREQARNGCVRWLAGRGRAVVEFRGNGLEECQAGLGQANRGSFDRSTAPTQSTPLAGPLELEGCTVLCAAAAEVAVSPPGLGAAEPYR